MFGPAGLGLISLEPIERALAELGYAERSGVGVLVEGWSVQFIPAADALDAEALTQATAVPLTGAPATSIRMLRAEHLVAKAVRLGRNKDFARIDAFLDQGAVDLNALTLVLTRHGLQHQWKAYCARSGRVDPLALS